MNASNKAAEMILIGKVQKGVKPTKAEACRLPSVINAYVVRCDKYHQKQTVEQMRQIYWTYKYMCDNWN